MASETMIQNAKAFLLQESASSNLNLYDHLCDILHKVLESKTPNAVDILEDISKEVKEAKYRPDTDPSAVSYFDFHLSSQIYKHVHQYYHQHITNSRVKVRNMSLSTTV